MIVYVDTSIILRKVLHEPDPLDQWSDITVPISSSLARVECARTFDRYRLRRHLDSDDWAAAVRLTDEILSRMTILDLTPEILRRAAQLLPEPVGTLDAIHLTTAARYRETQRVALSFATHDRELAIAARALGFPVIGTQIP